MDLKEARARHTSPRVTLLAALATIATLVGSGIVSVSDGSVSSAAVLGHGVPTRVGAVAPGLEAKAAAPRARTANATVVASAVSSFTSVYVPPPNLPVLVKAPTVKEAGAFAALNALMATGTRLGEAVVAMRVALDRAQAATSAGAGLWFVRQANASAEYALSASSLLTRFPALQAAVVRAFDADGMRVTLTPAQFAAAKAKLLRHLPASLPQLLAVAAAPYQPATVPEVAALKAAILDTAAFQKVVANLAPRALPLPSALASSSVTRRRGPSCGGTQAVRQWHLGTRPSIGTPEDGRAVRAVRGVRGGRTNLARRLISSPMATRPFRMRSRISEVRPGRPPPPGR